jgi:hypothetical protein
MDSRARLVSARGSPTRSNKFARTDQASTAARQAVQQDGQRGEQKKTQKQPQKMTRAGTGPQGITKKVSG